MALLLQRCPRCAIFTGALCQVRSLSVHWIACCQRIQQVGDSCNRFPVFPLRVHMLPFNSHLRVTFATVSYVSRVSDTVTGCTISDTSATFCSCRQKQPAATDCSTFSTRIQHPCQPRSTRHTSQIAPPSRTSCACASKQPTRPTSDAIRRIPALGRVAGRALMLKLARPLISRCAP